MTFTTKKVLLTILDIVIVLIAGYWVLWMTFYFTATIDGPILIHGAYALFERNYLVPIQIYGISAVIIALTTVFFCRLRRKNVISRSYIFLLIFNILPFALCSIIQTGSMVEYWNTIYR